jgi:hypothetical protein
MIILVILLFFVSPLLSFPGDQEPLSCIKAFNVFNGISIDDESNTSRQKLFAKGLAKSVIVIEDGETKVYDFTYGSDYQTTNHPSLSEEEYKAKMKSEAEAQFRTAIRKFHDRSVSITKLGDSYTLGENR